ncbi:MAG: DHA2 family efflux MFS transporter permease subunit [Pseudomonadota bacterium]
MRAGAELSKSLVTGERQTGCPKHLRKYVLAVAVLGSSLGFIDGTIITVAAQPIRTALGASFGEVQWVVNAYTLTLSAFLLIGGAAGDRYGTRRVFAAGVALFTLASVLCGVAPNVEALIAARAVQGLGAALMVPGSLALIAVNVPKAERGRAVGVWAAASGVTSALGPLLGGLLIDLGSWRWIFFINVPVAALTLALLHAKVPADRGHASGRFDGWGAALAFVAVGAVALGFTLAEAGGLTAPTALAALVAGTVAGALFLLHERRTASPMLPLGLFRARNFSVANGQTLLIYFALGGALFFLPVTLMSAHGWRAAEAGAVFLPFTVAMAIVSPLAGRVADRIGHRAMLFAGPLVVAVAFLALGAAAGVGDYFSAVVPAMALFGVGMGLAIPSLSAVVLDGAGEDHAGIASAVNNAVARVAGLLAVAALGLVASAVFAATLGEAGASFASRDGAAAADATIAAFQALCVVCAALAAAAAALSPFLSRPAPAAPA